MLVYLLNMTPIHGWLIFTTIFNAFVQITPIEPVVEFEWSNINYTWASRDQYQEAVRTRKYIPENIYPTGLKLHGGRIYLATPNYKGGVPFTLGYVSLKEKNKFNTPLVPFPNSLLHRERSCSNLQNVQTLEIDTKGIMWVLDGVRMSTTNCPPKLQQFDLNKGGKLIHTYVFPDEVSLQNGGFLNDIVLDNEDHAYITDTSNVDPGLVVYCRSKNKAWKFRDSSMFPGKDTPKYSIDNQSVVITAPIDGIALSPIPSDKSNKGRTVFYSALTGYDLFSVSADDVRNETLYHNGLWRKSIALVGKKQGTTDGMMMDNRGNLYYTLTSLNAIGKWNINEPFDRSEIFYWNKTMVWPDAFGIDDEGVMYWVSNHAINYLAPYVKLNFTSDIKFKIFKFPLGNKSYQYPK